MAVDLPRFRFPVTWPQLNGILSSESEALLDERDKELEDWAEALRRIVAT